MTSTRRCGRIGDHQPHTWRARSFGSQPMRAYACPGRVVTEGAPLPETDDVRNYA